MFDKHIGVCKTTPMTNKESVGVRLAVRTTTMMAIAVDIAARDKDLSRSNWLRRAIANQLEADRDKSPKELAAKKRLQREAP